MEKNYPAKEKNKNNTLMRSLALMLFVTSLCMFIMAEASYLISSRKVNQIATDYYRLVTEENSIRVSNWYTEQVAMHLMPARPCADNKSF